MDRDSRLKPHLWKLALTAVLIWLAILVQQYFFRSAATSPESPVTPQPTPSQPLADPFLETASTPVSSDQAKPTLPPPATDTPTVTPTPPPVFHLVQPGEAPLSIAAEYGISAEVLMAVNDITDPTTLQIGQKLIVPVTATPTPQASTPKASPTATPSPTYHTIQKGDVLVSIAAEYDTTVEAIMIANDITNPRTLQVGQQLLIPPHKGSPLGVETVVHEIESGDTLIGLATKYGSTLEDILATNPELEPTALQVGQQILVPLTQPRINPDADPHLPRITSPVPPSPGFIALEQEMFEAVNAQRQAQGLPPYTFAEELAVVARAHAQDMVARGYFSHVTPKGMTVRDRVAEHGLLVNWVGENIQRNTRPTNEAAQYAIEWFMNSRPHRNNILHPHYNRIGVGVAEGPTGWYTFVQVFAGD